MSEPSTQRLRDAQADDEDEPSTRRLRAQQEEDDEPSTQLLRPAQERVGPPPSASEADPEQAGPEAVDPEAVDTAAAAPGLAVGVGPVDEDQAGSDDPEAEGDPEWSGGPEVEGGPPWHEAPAAQGGADPQGAPPSAELPAEGFPTVEIPVVGHAVDATVDDAAERTVVVRGRGGPRAGVPPAGVVPSVRDAAATMYGPPPAGPLPIGPRPGSEIAPGHRVDSCTAAELTEDAIVRFRGDRPTRGWRGAVYKISAGLVNPGIGAAEQDRQEQLRRIRRPLPGSHQIAVSSIKGGVGKTTVSACLGLVMAENRGDRVIALDANPDAGTLADRLTAQTSVTVRNLLDNLGATHSLTDVARFTSLAGRLQVLASEQDPAMSEAFSREEYVQVCAVLTRFYNIVITDSGTGLVHSAMEGTLALAQSLVVVGSPTVDGASRASKTLDWLIAHGYATRVADAVVVLSCDRTSKEVDRRRVREHFEARCRAVVEVPHDTHLATGGRIELDRLRPDTLDAFIGLAALLAEGFGGPQPLRSAQPAYVPSLG